MGYGGEWNYDGGRGRKSCRGSLLECLVQPSCGVENWPPLYGETCVEQIHYALLLSPQHPYSSGLCSASSAWSAAGGLGIPYLMLSPKGMAWCTTWARSGLGGNPCSRTLGFSICGDCNRLIHICGCSLRLCVLFPEEDQRAVLVTFQAKVAVTRHRLYFVSGMRQPILSLIYERLSSPTSVHLPAGSIHP